MTICSNCGGENPPDSRFCARCGAALVSVGHEVRKTVTVLFCDVARSTQLGEQLDPESLRRVLFRFFETMKDVIERHGGTVEKFVGDAVMAVFGVPVSHEDDAFRAVRAADEMRDALAELNTELAGAYGATLSMRVGVNTGLVVTGTAERLATGDAVNVAARLEQVAGPGEVLLGLETARLVRSAITGEAVEPLMLKGKSEPLGAIRLLTVDPGGLSRRLNAPMVGRERELHSLHEAFAGAVADGVCRLCTIVGAAGVGKSRLVAAFLERVEATTVVHGRCLPYGDGISYWPVVEVVKQLPAAHSLALEPAAVEAIEGLVDAKAIRATSDEIAWGFRKLVEAAAMLGPLVCIFDDLQWGEETFVDLVEQFGYLSRSAPILLLCMARPELLDRRPGWHADLRLEPLSRAESDRLVADRLGGTRIEPKHQERILAAADGNPLFLEEMVAVLLESGDVAAEVPATIQALLAARLDQLEPAERAVLERGAIEGEIFHRGGVQALGPEEQHLTTILTALVRKDLLRPDKAPIAGEDAFRFRHLLIRDAAYEALAKSTRAKLHEQFALWLEVRGRALVERDELLGYHFERAYRYRMELGPVDPSAAALARRAGTRLLTAGRAALERKDAPAAIALLSRGCDLLPPGDPDRIKGLVDLTEARHWGGLGALAIVEQAIGEAQEAGDERLEAWGRLFRLYDPAHVVRASREERLRDAEETAAVFARHGDNAGHAHAWLTVAIWHIESGRIGDGAAALERAADYDRRTTDRRRESLLLIQSMVVKVYGPTPVEEGIAFGEALVEERGEARCLAAMCHLIRLYTMSGRGDDARTRLKRTVALAKDFGLPGTWAALMHAGGELEVSVGNLEAAERHFRTLVAQWDRATQWVAPSLAEVLLRLGRDDEAGTWLDRAERESDPEDIETQITWRAAKARMLARRGKHVEARKLAREAVERADLTEWVPLQAFTRVALGDVLATLNRPQEAAGAIRQGLELHERKGDVVGAAEARALLAKLGARSATAPR